VLRVHGNVYASAISADAVMRGLVWKDSFECGGALLDDAWISRIQAYPKVPNTASVCTDAAIAEIYPE
jgi:hypothetical protein